MTPDHYSELDNARSEVEIALKIVTNEDAHLGERERIDLIGALTNARNKIVAVLAKNTKKRSK